MKALLTRYAKHLLWFKPVNIYRRNSTGAATGEPAVLNHVLWMLGNMPDQNDVPKFNRWLGFVQGVLWAFGHYTLDDLRADVRAAGTQDLEERTQK